MFALNDVCIRTVIKSELLSYYSSDHDTLVMEELGVRHGSARVDIAVINKALQAIEIKSDCDNLDRLPHQIRVYGSVFDRITLVVGSRHVDRATEMIPNWWGIRLAEMSQSDQVHISTIREPQDNPTQEILAVTKLLWRAEALSLLEELDAADGFYSKPRAVIYACLVKAADSEWLRERIRQQLRSRTNWRSDVQQKSCDG